MAMKKVLIVEDDETLLKVLTVRCRNLQMEVITSADAIDARKKITRHVPDLIVLDINMPGGDAFSVCEMLSKSSQLSKIPVIILTGDTSHDTLERCRQYGAFYVPKSPYAWQTLKPMIGRLLNIPKAKY